MTARDRDAAGPHGAAGLFKHDACAAFVSVARMSQTFLSEVLSVSS